MALSQKALSNIFILKMVCKASEVLNHWCYGKDEGYSAGVLSLGESLAEEGSSGPAAQVQEALQLSQLYAQSTRREETSRRGIN